MKNKPETTMNNNDQKVKVIFNQPMKNINISFEKYAEARDAYFKDVAAHHGRPIALPIELNMISLKVQELFKEPYIYETGVVYEMSAADAEQYLSKHVEYTEDSKPRYFNDINDMTFYTKKFHFAEVAA